MRIQLILTHFNAVFSGTLGGWWTQGKGWLVFSYRFLFTKWTSGHSLGTLALRSTMPKDLPRVELCHLDFPNKRVATRDKMREE